MVVSFRGQSEPTLPGLVSQTSMMVLVSRFILREGSSAWNPECFDGVGQEGKLFLQFQFPGPFSFVSCLSLGRW